MEFVYIFYILFFGMFLFYLYIYVLYYKVNFNKLVGKNVIWWNNKIILFKKVLVLDLFIV